MNIPPDLTPPTMVALLDEAIEFADAHGRPTAHLMDLRDVWLRRAEVEQELQAAIAPFVTQ